MVVSHINRPLRSIRPLSGLSFMHTLARAPGRNYCERSQRYCRGMQTYWEAGRSIFEFHCVAVGTPVRVPPAVTSSWATLRWTFHIEFCWIWRGCVFKEVELACVCFFVRSPGWNPWTQWAKPQYCKTRMSMKEKQKFNSRLWFHLCPVVLVDTHESQLLAHCLGRSLIFFFQLVTAGRRLQSFVCLRRFPEKRHFLNIFASLSDNASFLQIPFAKPKAVK